MNWIITNHCTDFNQMMCNKIGYDISKTEITLKKKITNGIKFVNMIKDAIKNDIVIYIINDYDVDGIMSGAILKKLLLYLGSKNVIVRTPRRLSEGFGLNEKIIDEIPCNSMIITCDNGITSLEAIKKAKNKNIKVIVTDHHMPIVENNEIKLPCADLIIDAHLNGHSEFEHYCGAGLCFKLLQYFNCSRELIYECLIYACIGTIADLVPLIDENRVIVQLGLSLLNQKTSCSIGLNKLIEKLKLEYIDENSIGFKIAPVLNANGRLYDNGSLESLSIVTCDNFNDKISVLIENLIETNEKRKKIVEDTMKSLNEIERKIPIVTYVPNLCEGVVGLIASKIVEKYRTPAYVFTDAQDKNYIKGSARNFGDIDIKECLDKTNVLMTRFENPISKYGGHKGAGGITLKKEDYKMFIDCLEKSTDKNLITDNQLYNVYYDYQIFEEQIISIFNLQCSYAPFGMDNKKPVIRIDNITIKKINTYGILTRIITSKDNTIIGFNLSDEIKNKKENQIINILCTLEKNVYKGNSTIQCQIIDVK